MDPLTRDSTPAGMRDLTVHPDDSEDSCSEYTCSLFSCATSSTQTADDLPGAGRVIDTYFYQPGGRWIERKYAQFVAARRQVKDRQNALECSYPEEMNSGYAEQRSFSVWSFSEKPEDVMSMERQISSETKGMKSKEQWASCILSQARFKEVKRIPTSASRHACRLSDYCLTKFRKMQFGRPMRSQLELLRYLSDALELCRRVEFTMVSVPIVRRLLATQKLYKYNSSTQLETIASPILHFWQRSSETVSFLFKWWLDEKYTSPAFEDVIIRYGIQIRSLCKGLLQGLWHSWTDQSVLGKGCFLLPGWRDKLEDLTHAVRLTLKIASALHVLGAIISDADLDDFNPHCQCEDLKELIISSSCITKEVIDKIWIECVQETEEGLMKHKDGIDISRLQKRSPYLNVKKEQCLTQSLSPLGRRSLTRKMRKLG